MGAELDALAPPSPQTTVAVLLGASDYPRKSTWSNPVLRHSAHGFRDYLRSRSGLALPRHRVLDLFDDTAEPTRQLLRIGDFLAAAAETAHDLIVYYVGHGGFHRDEYHLGIRCTQQDREFITTLESRKLAQVIRREFPRKRLYVILDSCFSASAASDWQGGEIEAAVRKMAQPLPRQGTAFLAAASKYDVTRAPRAERYTVFTGVVLEALARGTASTNPRMSLYELYEEVRGVLRQRELDEEARPELHVPSQADGDVSRLGLFPNAAAEANRAHAEAAARRPVTLAASGSNGPRLMSRANPVREVGRAELVTLERGLASVTSPHPRDPPIMLLVGAVLAAVTVFGITVVDREITADGERAIAEALYTDVGRLTLTLHSAVRSTRLRADGIATTPILRAAIDTGKVSVNDFTNIKMMFSGQRGEVLEVFQLRGDQSTSVLRIPEDANPVLSLPDRVNRVQSDQFRITLAVSAPISGHRAGIAGGLVIFSEIDLMEVRDRFREHATRASLMGLGSDLALVGGDDGTGGAEFGAAPITHLVPSLGDWNPGNVNVVAMPKPAVGLTGLTQARYIVGGVGALLLLGFVVGVARRRAGEAAGMST